MGNTKRKGARTVLLESKPVIISTAAIVGKKEGEGPLGQYFDEVIADGMWEEDSWEKAESKFQRQTVSAAIGKASLKPEDIDYIFGGDLINQCCSTSFAIREMNMPFLGVYGACSTMSLSLALAAMMIDGGFAENTAALTSSHFCSAEKQFRFPLEYGGQRPPTAQWTVTGSGCAVLSASGNGPRVESVTIGRIVDKGITDANNMGAAMAPAAADTLDAHFKDTQRKPSDYDLIVTGDLGAIGKGIAADFLKDMGYDMDGVYNDCGDMIFDNKKQDTHAGGSGCGCSATTFCGYIYQMMKQGTFKRVLFTATGALMNTTTTQQGDSIPGIAHAVSLVME